MNEVENLVVDVRELGWCLVREVIPAGEVERVRLGIEGTIQNLVVDDPSGRHPGILAISGLVNFDQTFVPYLDDRRITGINECLLKHHFRISFTTGIITHSGNRRGGWHADWPYDQFCAGSFPAPYLDGVAQVTTIWMLTDFYDGNGTTIVLNGSHRRSNNPTGSIELDAFAPIEGEVHISGRAGDVLVFDSRKDW